jgi:3',5'-cyclic AMP phosphodiesterase CpdA
MTVNIFPYAQLAKRPTTQMWVGWIDKDTSRNDDPQILKYRIQGSDDDWQEKTSSPVAIPTTDYYKHEVFINGLRSGTTYEVEIAGEKECTFKTLPSRVWRSELTICVISDIHIDTRTTGGMRDGEEMEELADQEPDALIIGGDIVTWGNSSTENATEIEIVADWVMFFDDHIDNLNKGDKLIPLFVIPGNHEVGNNTWDGTGSVDPTDGFLQFFFSNVKEVDVIGQNYGTVDIPNLLQIIGLDTQSAYAGVQAEWLSSKIRTDNLVQITTLHNGFFTGGNRNANDEAHAGLLRQEVSHIIARSNTTSIAFSGHVHTEKRTEPLRWVGDEPSSGNYFTLDNGYLVSGTDEDFDIIEFGEGYRNNRSAKSEWYLDYASGSNDSNNAFFIVKITTEDIEVTMARIDSEFTIEKIYSANRVPIARKALMV